MRFSLDLTPAYHAELLFFEDVENSTAIKKLLIAGSLNATAFDPMLITDIFHLLVAIQDAVFRMSVENMVTKTLASEILYRISSGKNIGEAFRLHGIKDDGKQILFVLINPELEDIKNLRDMVQGIELLDVPAGIQKYHDDNKIKSIYKVKESEIQGALLGDVVVNRMAVRDLL